MDIAWNLGRVLSTWQSLFVGDVTAEQNYAPVDIRVVRFGALGMVYHIKSTDDRLCTHSAVTVLRVMLEHIILPNISKRDYTATLSPPGGKDAAVCVEVFRNGAAESEPVTSAILSLESLMMLQPPAADDADAVRRNFVLIMSGFILLFVVFLAALILGSLSAHYTQRVV